MADNKSRELMVKVDVDVSEALTGLKALQREAKKATQAVAEMRKELDDYYLPEEKEAFTKLVSYGIDESLAEDAIASRTSVELATVIRFLDRYGKFINRK